jgi:uncharacterized membrane protein YjgN (DUF898 family)
MTCPRCHEAETEGEKCPHCGVVVAAYLSALEKMRRAPTPSRAATAAPVAPAVTAVLTASAPGPAPAPSRGAFALSFHGRGGTLFGIQVVNMLRALLTLGAYCFWGKVRVRRYVFGQTALEGDRFVYHGTGRELASGFAKAMAFFMLPVLTLNLLPTLLGAGEILERSGQLLGYVFVSVFMPIAMVGAHRYRLSRTSWRGIRFSFRGQTWDFVKLFLHGSMLTTLTLGLYYPLFDIRRRAFMVAHAHFGNRRFGFDGNGRQLVLPFLVAILLTLPTLGLCWFWYVARRRRYFWQHTTFDRARFHSSVTGRLLLNLMGGNVLLLVATLGLGWPWVLVRNAQFACDTLRLTGTLDLTGIVQAPQSEVATGDALSTFLGMDAGIA